MRDYWREKAEVLWHHWGGLVRRPAYAIGIVVMLSLAVGAAGVAFSFFHATELAPLKPYPQARRLAFVGMIVPKMDWGDFDTTPQSYLDMLKQSGGLIRRAGMSINGRNEASLDIDGVERAVTVESVTPSIYSTLGLVPALGRWPLQTPPGLPVAPQAVITYHFWQQAYGGRRDVLGKVLPYEGTSYRIVGVLPRRETFLSQGVGVLLPYAIPMPGNTQYDNANDEVLVRLPQGVSDHALALSLQSVNSEILANLPPQKRQRAQGTYFKVTPFRQGWLEMQSIAAMPWALMGSALLLWLLATVNASNLALVRHRRRMHEFAIRNALGAGPWRLLGFLFIEQLPLLLLVFGLGALLAWKSVAALKGSSFDTAPFTLHIGGAEFAFMAVLALLTLLTASIGPVLQMRASQLRAELGQGHRITLGRGTKRLLRGLGALQAALAVALLGSSLVLAGALYGALHRPLGFRPQHRLVVTVSLPAGQDAGVGLSEIVEAVRGLPYTRMAASTLAGTYPFSDSLAQTTAHPPGSKNQLFVLLGVVSPGYFATLGIPVRAGKPFEAGQNGLLHAMVVSEEACRRAYPHTSCIGKLLNPVAMRVQGVVDNVVWTTKPLRGHAGEVFYANDNALFRKYHISIDLGAILIDGRHLTRPSVQAAIKRRVLAAVPGVSVVSMKSYPSIIRKKFSEQIAITAILLYLAGIALALSAYGVWAVNGAIAQARMPEFALRAVLGAQPRQLVLLALRESAWVLGLGLLPGIMAGVVVARQLAAGWYASAEIMPYAFVSGALLVSLLVLFTAWLPVRRATRASLATLRTQ